MNVTINIELYTSLWLPIPCRRSRVFKSYTTAYFDSSKKLPNLPNEQVHWTDSGNLSKYSIIVLKGLDSVVHWSVAIRRCLDRSRTSVFPQPISSIRMVMQSQVEKLTLAN